MRGETVNLSSASTWFSRAVCSSNSEAQRETSIAGPCLEHSGGPIVTSAEWASGRGRKASPIAEAWRRAMDKMMSRLIFTSKGLGLRDSSRFGLRESRFPGSESSEMARASTEIGFSGRGPDKSLQGHRICGFRV